MSGQGSGSGGAVEPNRGQDPGARGARTAYYRRESWGWSGEVPPGRQVSLLGLLLLALGGYLLLQQLFPAVQLVGSVAVLAVGVGLLLFWASRRYGWLLYAGTLVTAYAIPHLLGQLKVISGGGWTTLSIGIGFLFIALVRGLAGGGWGWQVAVGGLLALIGGATIAEQQLSGFPSAGALIWPALLLFLGVVLVIRSVGRR